MKGEKWWTRIGLSKDCKAEGGMMGGCHQPRQTLWIRAYTDFTICVGLHPPLIADHVCAHCDWRCIVSIRMRMQLTGCTIHSIRPTYNLVLVKNSSASTRRPVLTQKTLCIMQVKYVGYASTNRCQILLPFATK